METQVGVDALDSASLQVPNLARKASIGYGKMVDQRPTEDRFDKYRYPAGAPSIHPAVTSPAQCQTLLRSSVNFSDHTDCDLLEVYGARGAIWKHLHSKSLLATIAEAEFETEKPSLRVFFIEIEQFRPASFGGRVLIEPDIVEKFLAGFRIHPHFVQFLLGNKDYLAPFCSQESDEDGNTCFQFMCQLPRWYPKGILGRSPCSVFLMYDTKRQSTTYVVASGKDEPFVQKARKTLIDSIEISMRSTSGAAVNDPFLLCSILARESLLRAEVLIRNLRRYLHDQLERVDTLTGRPFDRALIKEVTNALSDISQDCSKYLARIHILRMITYCMTQAHQRMSSSLNTRDHIHIEDSLRYINEAAGAQKRWLQSYIARKNVAMKLLYQMVMQQDSETSQAIARATRDDSAVMKFIAIVTMLFLPQQAVASFFGMQFFIPDSTTEGSVSDKWWIYWSVSVPLTCVVVGLSYVWWKWKDIKALCRQIFTEPAASVSEDVELGQQAVHPPPSSTPSAPFLRLPSASGSTSHETILPNKSEHVEDIRVA